MKNALITHLEKRLKYAGLKIKPQHYLLYTMIFTLLFTYFGSYLLAAIFPLGPSEKQLRAQYEEEVEMFKKTFQKMGKTFDEDAYWKERLEEASQETRGKAMLLALILSPLISYFFLIYLAQKRTTELERDLPDALLLISSFVKAGGTIDWAIGAVLHHLYGPLHEEFDETARQLAAGASIEAAMSDLAERNDSPLLRNLSDLVLFSIRAGGEMTDLLTDIAMEIRMTQTLQAELEAQVASYKMFFTITILFIAPFLLAVATNFLGIAKSFGSRFQQDLGGGTMSAEAVSTLTGPQAGLAGRFMEKIIRGELGGKITVEDMRLFSYSLCILSSISASMLLGVIARGEEKAGLAYVPLFVIVSVLVFFYSDQLVGEFLASAFEGM